jgi:hypothetical protein
VLYPRRWKYLETENLLLRAAYRILVLSDGMKKQVSLFHVLPKDRPRTGLQNIVMVELCILSEIMDKAQIKCRSKSLSCKQLRI